MAYGTVNGKPLTTNKHEDHQQQELEQQEEVQDRAKALALKLAQTYEELTRLLERNPGVKRQITEGAAKEDKVYQKLKQRLKMADMAPRCRWVRQDGTSCRSPQMKRHIYCFAHKQMAEARDLMLRLPPPEDANAIQVGLMRIQKAVIEDTISMKKAGLLLYSMQLALTNVGQTTFGKAKDEELVRETVDEEEALSEDQNQHQHQRPFTAKDAEDAKEKSGLPRMNTDERGLEPGRMQVEWKPTPDMYRMDTPEGREAYEASFQTKIKPRVAGERDETIAQPRAPLPQQANTGIVGDPRAVPHEHSGAAHTGIAETHAILG
ncbi:MAG TPA: hypothetical protein VGH51_11680 [Candidatus Angelobacter sp.]|jgi:hypothetical protein